MPSKTPFFNMTLFGKNTTRFWPLWAIYGTVWFLALTMTAAVEMFGANSASNTVTNMTLTRDIYGFTCEFGIIMAAVSSCFCAMAVLSYLYTARSAGFMHSLPIKRGGLFLTSYISGYLFMLVPNIVVFAATAAITAAGGYSVVGALLTWMLMISGMELFFYSFAMLCGVMTGQILMLPVLYGILNFLVVGMYTMFTILADVFLYGYSAAGMAVWEIFSPAVKLVESINVDTQWDDSYMNLLSCSISGCKVVAAYAVVGAALAVAAYVFSLFRKSETASDSISFGWARVAFKFGVGFCAAFTLGQIFYELFVNELVGANESVAGILICTLVAGAIGYYAAQMLMEKSFRVFAHGRICAAVVAVSIIAVCLMFAADVLGYENKVPQAEDVKSVEMSIGGWEWTEGTVSDLDNILLVTEIHQTMIDEKTAQKAAIESRAYSVEKKSGYTDNTCSVSISYNLADGSTLSRSYTAYLKYSEAKDVSTLAGMICELAGSEEYMLSNTLKGAAVEDIIDASIDYIDAGGNWQQINLTKKETADVYAAITADIKANNMSAPQMFYYYDGEEHAETQSNPYANNAISFSTPDNYISITPEPEMTNLIEALRLDGILSRIGH